MKKLTKNLILLAILALLSQSAFCYILTPSELHKILVKKELQNSKENLKQYSDKIEVTVTGYPNENIITSDNSCPNISIITQDIKFRPNTFKRVLVKDSKNNLIKSFGINVRTKVYKNVLVANSMIQYNQGLNSQNTVIKEMEISKYLGKTLSQLNNEVTSNANFQKDAIITSDRLKEKSAILKNSTIDIIFLSNKGLTIRIQGKALKEGAIGDTILVRSDKYNKTYNAIVNSPREAIVRI